MCIPRPAARGKDLSAQCAFCHQSDLRGQGFAPALVEDTFTSRWQDGNLGDLLTIVKVTMPQDKPASLTDDENAAIVAYLLQANRYPAGQQELQSRSGRSQGSRLQAAGARRSVSGARASV